MILDLMQAEELLKQIEKGEVSAADEVYSDMYTLIKAAKYGREMEAEYERLREELRKLKAQPITGNREKEVQLEKQIHVLEAEKNTALAQSAKYRQHIDDIQKVHDEKIANIHAQHQKKFEELEQQIKKLTKEKTDMISEKKLCAQEWEKKHNRNWRWGTIAVLAVALILMVAVLIIACFLKYNGVDVLQDVEFRDIYEKLSTPSWFIIGGILGLIILISTELDAGIKRWHAGAGQASSNQRRS